MSQVLILLLVIAISVLALTMMASGSPGDLD